MQKYLYNASKELVALGHEVRTIGSATLTANQALDVNNVVVNTPDTPKPTLGSLWSSKRSLDTVVDLIRDLRPDVVHFVNKHIWNYLLIKRVRWNRISTRWVHTFHDPIGHEGDAVQRGVIAYHKLIQRSLDAVIVHSDTARHQTDTALRPSCLVAKVPLGDKRWKSYEPVPAHAAKHVLVFGRLNLYKGCTMYPAIFTEVYMRDPDVRIVVAGKPSKELPDGLLDRIAACPNVDLQARFIEEVEVEGYFRAASVVLTPYTSMTQSGVILDAYCHSRPILPFMIDGMSEFLPHAATSVTPFDTSEYAQTLVSLVGDAQACAAAGRAAWEFGRAHFSPSSMAAGFNAVYDALTSRLSDGPQVR